MVHALAYPTVGHRIRGVTSPLATRAPCRGIDRGAVGCVTVPSLMPRLLNAHLAQHDELAALCALDLLEGQELVEFQTHLAMCARCCATVEYDRRTLALLGAAAPEMEPS